MHEWQQVSRFVPITGQAVWSRNVPITSLSMQQRGEILQWCSLSLQKQTTFPPVIYGYESLTGRRRSKFTVNKIKRDEKSYPLTCAAFTGGPLRTTACAQIPVDRCLRRGQHPIVAEGGCSCCQGLASQSCTWLVHGIGIGYRHSHVHGEVLLGQCCRLKKRDTGIYTQTP